MWVHACFAHRCRKWDTVASNFQGNGTFYQHAAGAQSCWRTWVYMKEDLLHDTNINLLCRTGHDMKLKRHTSYTMKVYHFSIVIFRWIVTTPSVTTPSSILPKSGGVVLILWLTSWGIVLMVWLMGWCTTKVEGNLAHTCRHFIQEATHVDSPVARITKKTIS